MEIVKRQTPEAVVLAVSGRLDATWADHLERELTAAVRAGARNLRLDAAEVTFLSSAGIRILIKCGRDLKRIGGSFGIVNPSEPVYRVLELSGLLEALNVRPAEAQAPPEQEAAMELATVTLERDGCTLACAPLPAAGAFTCRLVGDAAGPAGPVGHPTRLQVGGDGLIVGIGALGDEADACPGWGELLAAAGAAVHQPSGRSAAPDYMLAAAAFVPTVRALHCLVCRGAFSHGIAFEPRELDATLSLSGLVAAALEAAEAEAVAMVIVAEAAALVGATMKQAAPASGGFYDFPGIRERLGFASEPVWTRPLALVAGVAARGGAGGGAAAYLRPVDAEGALRGHFHAAAFAYHALPVHMGGVAEAVGRLFEAGPPLGAMHLLHDDRGAAGVGESRWVRGSAWIGPITEFAVGAEVVA